LLKANVSLSQISWKAVPPLQTCSCKIHCLESCSRFVSQHTFFDVAECNWRQLSLETNWQLAASC